MHDLRIQPLEERQDLLPTLRAWFEAEWPGWDGAGGRGDAAQDLRACSQRGRLPLGLVALRGDQPCGFAALKAEPFPGQPAGPPWAGAACVPPALRRQGIGAALLRALEREAAALGHPRICCATATAQTLLERGGWRLLRRVLHEGQPIALFEKRLDGAGGEA